MHYTNPSTLGDLPDPDLGMCSGHQPLLLPRSALHLPGQKFLFGFLCAKREHLQCGNVSGSAVGVCLAVGLWPSASVSRRGPVHHWWDRKSRTDLLASGKRGVCGGLSQLGKIHVTGEAGMQWECICSCAGQWVVGRNISVTCSMLVQGGDHSSVS